MKYEEALDQFSKKPVEALVQIVISNKLFLIDSIILKYGINDFRSKLIGSTYRITDNLSREIDPDAVLDNFEHTTLTTEVRGVVDIILRGKVGVFKALPDGFEEFSELHGTDLLYRLTFDDLSALDDHTPNEKLNKLINEIANRVEKDPRYAMLAASFIQGRFGYDFNEASWISKGNEEALSNLMKSLLSNVGLQHKNLQFYKLAGAMIEKTGSMRLLAEMSHSLKSLYPGTPSKAYEQFGRSLVEGVLRLEKRMNNTGDGSSMSPGRLVKNLHAFIYEDLSNRYNRYLFSLRQDFAIRASDILFEYSGLDDLNNISSSVSINPNGLVTIAGLDNEDFSVICGADDLHKGMGLYNSNLIEKTRYEIASAIKLIEKEGVEKVFATCAPSHRKPFAVFCLKAMAKSFDEPTPFLNEIIPHVLNMAGDLSQFISQMKEQTVDISCETIGR